MTRRLPWTLVGLGAVVVIQAMIAGAAFWWAFRPPPVSFVNAPFPTNNPVRVGTALGTVVERCNASDETLTTTIARSLVSVTGETWTLTPGAGIIDPGCSVIHGGIGLPPDVRPGRYYVRQEVRVNGRWQGWSYSLRTQEFDVVP